MDLPLGQHLYGKRHTSNPNAYGFPAARARSGWRSPDGQFGPRELLGQGRGAKQSLPLGCCNKPLSSPPPSRQERCRRRRAACVLCRHVQPWLCHGAARSISGEAQRGRAGAWQEHGAVGQQQVLPCRLLPPSPRGSGAERGRWRLPGFWLARAMELGRRCHSSLRFNRAAAAPR